jgi:hypothetical protein
LVPLASKLVGIVEQTTAGERLPLKRLAQGESYPTTISLARSRAKTQIENHFIAERIWEESSLLLAQTGRFLQYQLVLVLGYGILGRSVAHKFRARGCHVVVYDVRGDCRDAARAEGFVVADGPHEWPREVSVVLGLTGNDSVDPSFCLHALRSRREPLVLISGSSRRKQFAGVIAMLDAIGVEFAAHPWGRRYQIAGAGGGIDLIADGLPVIFFRRGSDSLANRMSDLVLAELTQCAAWALQSSRAPSPPRLFRFGRNDLITVGHESEAALIDRWCVLNGISPQAATAGGNPAIGPHPYECHIMGDSIEAELMLQ